MGKLVKRMSTALLAICLTVLCFTFKTYAAEGTLQFSDPTGAAGENITVTAKVNAGDTALGDVDVTVTYDKSALKFVSGTNATGGDGTVQLSYKGDGTSQEAAFSMEFTALKEGTSKLEASAYTAYLYSDEVLTLSQGDSTVTIEGGTPVSGDDADKDSKDGKASSGSLQVEVDGVVYTVNENFSEAAIPRGFTAVDTELDGTATKAMIQEASGQYLYYLEDTEGNSDYFLYSTDDGSFFQTEVVDVNTDVSIYLMDHMDSEGLPSEYSETTIDIGGKIFTAWYNTSNEDYYLVYALSSEGIKGYYQYDATEKTYQRYTVPATVKKEESGNSLTDKVMNFMEKHLTIIMCAVWGVFLLLLIVIIVLAIKLSHRNQELDDLYDEYGIGDDDDANTPHVKQKSRNQFVGYDDEDDEDYEEEDDYDGYEEDDDLEEYGADFEIYDEEDDDFEDYDDDFEDYDDDDGFEELEDDDDFEDRPVKRDKRAKKKDDDDFSVDFIDL